MPRHTNLAQSVKTTAIDPPVLAQALRQTLNLRHEPVALSFVRQQPDGLDVFSDTVPSACTFWRHAEQRTFFASAEAHYHCPIGALTMGFSMLESPGDKSGIVYGPLETALSTRRLE